MMTPAYNRVLCLYRGTHVYISQLIYFARVTSRVTDLDGSNKVITAEFLLHGYRYLHREAFSKLYLRRCELKSKLKVGLTILLQLGLSEQEFHGDLV